MTRPLVPVLAAGALGWVALLTAAPLLPTAAAVAVYAAGSLLCHQIAERSFHLQSIQLPVCARCFGLYAGGAVGATACLFAGLSLGRVGRLPRRTVWLATAVSAVPTVVTFTAEWLAGWRVTNLARAVAGVPLGAVAAVVVAGALATLHYDECAPPRPSGLGQPPSTST